MRISDWSSDVCSSDLVVPVDGQPWDSDPFVITEKDGKLYGRGTCDMKSFIAIGLAAVPDMLSAGLKRPIHFALSYDEEIGCEIGRASCRERVCMYVTISVGDVTLKKKKQIITQ